MQTTLNSLIAAAERGDLEARDSLFATLYGELHRLARRELDRHGYGASISVTTLLHEAYLSMGDTDNRSFPDRARFMGYAARVMRGVIIDHARERHAIKRGGGFEITSLAADAATEVADHQQLSAISAALDDLSKVDKPLAEIVDLRFFCGFSVSEIAAMFETSERTVHRRWEKARIFLRQYLRPDEGAEG